MNSYFDHNAKGASWDVLPFPTPIDVTEHRLTDHEAEQFRRRVKQWIETRNDSSRDSCSPADAG